MPLDRISFTTFNLLNLQGPGRPMNRGQRPWTAEEVEAKVAWTAAMLGRARADVVGFQELWGREPLDEALARSELSGSHELLVPPGHAGDRIVCAAAVPLGQLAGPPEWIDRFPEELVLRTEGDAGDQAPEMAVAIRGFSRPVLHLALRQEEGEDAIHVYVAHLKSKRPTPVHEEGWFDRRAHGPHAQAIGSALSTIRRTAEAAALRAILTARMKGTASPTVVLGDLNDDQMGTSVALVTEEPPLLWPSRFGGRDTALYSGQAMQQAQSQRDVYFTYIHEGLHSSLDHVLVSREFYSQSRNRVWALDGLDVWNDHLNDGNAEEGRGANDHGVVRARFSRPR